MHAQSSLSSDSQRTRHFESIGVGGVQSFQRFSVPGKQIPEQRRQLLGKRVVGITIVLVQSKHVFFLLHTKVWKVQIAQISPSHPPSSIALTFYHKIFRSQLGGELLI